MLQPDFFYNLLLHCKAAFTRSTVLDDFGPESTLFFDSGAMSAQPLYIVDLTTR
jgi:hypothetical protein